MENTYLKKLIQNSSTLLKKYNFFQQNHRKYLYDQNLTVQTMNSLKQLFSIDYNMTVNNEQEEQILKQQNLGLIRLLMVKSFYSNSTLFKFLLKTVKEEIPDYSLDKFVLEFKKQLYKKKFNETVDIFDIQQLKHNFTYVDNKDMVFSVLENSLIHNNQELYDFISPYLDFKNDYEKIMNSMTFVIENYGAKIANQPLAEQIRKHINKDTFMFFEIDTRTKKKEANFNKFFDITIKDFVFNNTLYQSDVKRLDLSDSKLESILRTIKTKTQNYHTLIVDYIIKKDSKKSVAKKFSFLQEQQLITENVWEYLINYNDDFLKTVFCHNKNLKDILLPTQLQQALTLFPQLFFKNKQQISETIQYIEACPILPDRENLISIVNNTNSYYAYRTQFEIQAFNYTKDNYSESINVSASFINNMNQPKNESYYKSLEEEFTQLIDYLYEKFPHYMNNELTLLDFVKSSKNDLFISIYLEKYFNDNPDNSNIKENIAKNLHVFTTNRFTKSLNWLIENKLLNTALHEKNVEKNIFSNETHNYLIPYLIDYYELSPDLVTLATLTGHKENLELFDFLLKNYKLQPITQTKLCNFVYVTNKTYLAEKIFKQGLIVHPKTIQQCNLVPNEAGNILLKSDLKQKLENKTLSTRQKLENKVKKI